MIKSGNTLSVKLLENLSLESFITLEELCEKVGEQYHNVRKCVVMMESKHLVEKIILTGGILAFKKLIN